MLILGTPAAHARRLARRARLGQGAALLAVAAASAVALGWPSRFPSLDLDALTFAALVVVAAMSVAVDHFARQARKASVGARSERRVATKLARIKGLEAVLHGTLIGAGGDADHIALGPVCAVIETKTGRGRVSVQRDGSLRAGARTIPGDPVAQARRQAATLTKLTGVTASAIVCIPDATAVPAQPINGVWICSLGELGATLARLDRPLDPARARHVATDLHRRGQAEQQRRDAATSRR